MNLTSMGTESLLQRKYHDYAYFKEPTANELS